MSFTASHTPVIKAGKIPYTLSWSTRLGRDILDDARVRKAALSALEAAADMNDARILSVATTGSSVRCDVLAPYSLSPSTLLSRLKNAAARAITNVRPELLAAQGGVFRRTGHVEPIASETMPRHAEPRSRGPENPTVSRAGIGSSGTALRRSAPHAASASHHA